MVETWRGIACDDAAERQKQLFSTLRIAEGYLPTADGAAAMLNAKTSGYATSVDNSDIWAPRYGLRSKPQVADALPVARQVVEAIEPIEMIDGQVRHRVGWC